MFPWKSKMERTPQIRPSSATNFQTWGKTRTISGVALSHHYSFINIWKPQSSQVVIICWNGMDFLCDGKLYIYVGHVGLSVGLSIINFFWNFQKLFEKFKTILKNSKSFWKNLNLFEKFKNFLKNSKTFWKIQKFLNFQKFWIFQKFWKFKKFEKFKILKNSKNYAHSICLRTGAEHT